MPDHDALSGLQALDAVAGEQGAVLAFRVREGTDEVEPVFVRVFRADGEPGTDVALISIDDGHGMSLGRYVIGRERLNEALAQAEDVEEESPAPEAIPVDWS